MNDQPTLFNESSTIYHANPRQEKIIRAYERTSDAFIDDYTRFLTAYADDHADFIACDVTASFEKAHYKLTLSEKRGLGHLYQRLQKENVIEKTGGFRERDQGSPAAIYRKKRGGKQCQF